MTRWREVGRLRDGDPSHIAGFDVVGRLGEGGMGVVYLAEHPELGPAAVKFVRREALADRSFRDRFRREVEVAERIRSPRVAPVLAADPDADPPWLAAAFVDGPTLEEVIDESGPMEGERLLALAVALADALAAIHRGGVVHRDLKPANILLTPETPVVIDFGIAWMKDAPALTQTGIAIGTPGWMAPEQVTGRDCGPRTDVFAWSMVVAYAASGRPPFGRGQADALFYRILHEDPDLPEMEDPLGMVVRAGLAKDPDARPDIDEILAVLTGQTLQPTVVDATAVDPASLPETVDNRTAVVPTIMALGWGVDALPTRPDGRPRSVPNPPPTAPPAHRAAATSGPAFWYVGREHHDARSLAAALQSSWDDAVEQIFRRRDPIWLGELRAFLQARGLDAADQIVRDGSGTAPPAAALARLLLALDPGLEPRVGDMWLTPDGLTAAARAVVDGRDDGARLADIGAARVLRLWRGLPGMEWAASIDERWHDATEAFGGFVARVSNYAGWPSRQTRDRAVATLLLCTLHPDHQRDLAGRLAAEQRTEARRQAWWAELAAEGQRTPAAAVVAVLTADQARLRAHNEVEAAHVAARQRERAEQAARQQRAVPPPPPAAGPAPVRHGAPAATPGRAANDWRYVPLRRAQPAVASGVVLVLTVLALLVHVYLVDSVGGVVVANLTTRRWGTSAVDAFRWIRRFDGLAVLLVVALPSMYVATRVLVRKGAERSVVRLYAGGAAAVDLLLGLMFVVVAAMAALVLVAGVGGAEITGSATSFGDGLWLVAGGLALLGFVAPWLIIRSVWRLGRALFGGTVAGPPLPAR